MRVPELSEGRVPGHLSDESLYNKILLSILENENLPKRIKTQLYRYKNLYEQKRYFTIDQRGYLYDTFQYIELINQS